jgi:hypothetical protein
MAMIFSFDWFLFLGSCRQIVGEQKAKLKQFFLTLWQPFFSPGDDMAAALFPSRQL